MLSKHIQPGTILEQARKEEDAGVHQSAQAQLTGADPGPYAARYQIKHIPRHQVPAESLTSSAAYQVSIRFSSIQSRAQAEVAA